MSRVSIPHRLSRDGKAVPELGSAMKVARSDDEGQQSVSVSTSSEATTDAVGADTAVVYSTVECFVLSATTPTATVAAGTPIPANVLIRLTGIDPADKLAFIAAAGSGTAYIRPGA